MDFLGAALGISIYFTTLNIWPLTVTLTLTWHMGNMGSAHPLVKVNVSFKFEGNPSISKEVIERTRSGDGPTDRLTDRPTRQSESSIAPPPTFCGGGITMAKAKRSKTKMYLLGEPVTVLTGSKLPSLRMTLGLFLHHHIKLKQKIRKSSAVTITEIAKFWLKARRLIKDHQHCQTKLEKVFEEWKLLKKNKGQTNQQLNFQKRQTLFPSLMTYLMLLLSMLLPVHLYYKKIRIFCLPSMKREEEDQWSE